MKKILVGSVSVLASLIAMPALAQVDEIVVTAQKVEENLQDVPIAISTLGANDIESSAAVNIEQLQQLIPSLNFRKGTTNANSALILRGVGTISFSIAAEPSVSTVVDGVVLSRSGQAFSDLYDIERIEVLRGPQGTLFGRNASAGVVNVVTKGGTEEFESQLQLGLFEESEYRAKLSVSGPLSDTLSARATGFYNNYDGNITNIFGGGDNRVNGFERFGGRVVFDWAPSEIAKIRLAADYTENDDDCCAEVTGVSRGALLDAELGFDTTRGEGQRVINQNLVTRTLEQNWGASLQGDFDVLSGHTFTTIAAYRNWENTEVREGDFLPRALVGTAELHDLGVVNTDQYSLEARLASPRGQLIEYVLGGFYWHSDNSQDFTRDDITCASSTLPAGISGGVPCNITDTVNTLFPTATSRSDVNIDNFAFFGQATWNVSDRLRLTGGIRYTNDDIEFTHTRAPGVNAFDGSPATGPGVSGNPAGGTIASGGNGTNTATGQTDNTNISGRAVIQYDWTDDFNTYASYTRGYKGPAFNVFFNFTAPNNAVPIDEETSNALEAGFKSRYFDNRLQVNAAGFYAEYDGFQANNFVLLNGATITNLTNAGTITTAGFELDAIATPTPWWTITGSVAYADAKVKEFNPNPLTNAPDARNGTRLPLAPRWSSAVVSETRNSLDIVPLDMYFRTAWTYQGDQFSDLGEGGPIEGRSLVDASLGFSDRDDKYRLTFHVRNLFNESYVLLNTQNSVRLLIPRDADRYVGVTFRANFN